MPVSSAGKVALGGWAYELDDGKTIVWVPANAVATLTPADHQSREC